jgi:hypothetical protein
LKNEKFKEEIQNWSKDTSYSCRSFIIILDFKNERFLSNFDTQLLNFKKKKKSKKFVVVDFFYFLNFALKNTFSTRPHTCHSKIKWWINLKKSIKIFEGAVFKNH